MAFQSDLGLAVFDEGEENGFEVRVGDQVCEQVDMSLVQQGQRVNEELHLIHKQIVKISRASEI